MWNSAEIRKSYHLAKSTHRLLLTPLVLLALFVIAYKISGMGNVALFSLVIYSLVAIYYGGLCAARCFSQEFERKTWDNIRLSSLRAWDITLGKLFGSTLYAWYGGLLALLGLVSAMGLNGFAFNHLLDLILLIMAGLLVQAIAMVIDLQSIETSSGGRSITNSILVLLIAFVLANNAIVSLVSSDLHPILAKSTTPHALPPQLWYGKAWPALIFTLLSSVIFFFWIITAVHRRVKEVLHCKQFVPWVWASFLLYLIVYLNGFKYEIINNAFHQVKYQMAFAVSAISTYAVIAYQANDVIRYRLLWTFYRSKQWRQFAESIPLWWISFAYTLISAIGIVSADANQPQTVSLSIALISGCLFMFRDIGVILFFGLSAKVKNTRIMSVSYLLILYLLLPLLLMTTGFKNAYKLFYPVINEQSYVYILPSLLQAGIILGLLVFQNRRQRALMG